MVTLIWISKDSFDKVIYCGDKKLKFSAQDRDLAYVFETFWQKSTFSMHDLQGKNKINVMFIPPAFDMENKIVWAADDLLST